MLLSSVWHLAECTHLLTYLPLPQLCDAKSCSLPTTADWCAGSPRVEHFFASHAGEKEREISVQWTQCHQGTHDRGELKSAREREKEE